MEKTLKEIAVFVGGVVEGDDNIVITGVSGIKEAKPGDITFVANTKYVSLMNHTQASAIIVSREIETNTSRPLIRVENPSLAFAKIVSLLAPNELILPKGIHRTAVVGKNVRLEKNVALGPHVVIEDNVEIGDGSALYAGVYVGHHTRIGKDSLIYPNVSIRERVTIGNRVIIHSGTVIGSDGFGFATVRGVHHRIPQIGTVVIEDDVEIGSNVTIDRARFDKTWIKRGTKIDNLVQIAHNVVIGEDTIVVAQTGISGSTTIGNNVILAGQSGVIGHIEVGDNVVVGAQAGVTKSVPPGTVVSGFPAKPHKKAKRINACIQRLPALYKLIKELQATVAKLEEKWKNREQ